MRKLLTAIGLLAIVGAIFYGARASDDGASSATSTQPRPGVQGLDGGFHGSKRPPMPRINIKLVDHRGERITLQETQKRATLFAFVPRRCDGECPVVLDQVRGALDLLPSNARPSVTVVPTEVPSSQDVNRIARWHGLAGRIRVARGPAPAIQATLREFKLSLNKAELELAYVVLVDRDLRQRVAFVAHTLTPEALASDLRTLESDQ